MGLKYLLDTNILSEPTKKQPNPYVIERLAAHAGECATAVTVWHELHYGVMRLPPTPRKQALLAYLEALGRSNLPILPYEGSAAVWLAQERARLALLGIPVPYADSEIAAIAHAHQLVLVTRNVTDFSVYTGLQVENWFNAPPHP